MPSYKDLFPDKWLRPETLGNARPRVVIEDVTVEKLWNPTAKKYEPKLVVAFHGKELRLVCNKTQAQSLATICGTEDYTKWQGYAVILSATRAANGKDTIAVQAAPKVNEAHE